MDIKEQLVLYVKDNERLVDELKNLRHFTLNIIHGVNGCIELEDWDGLKEFFYNILENYKRVTDTNFSSIEKIKNISLKELLLVKLKKGIDKSIDFKIHADSNILIENNLINEDDLCKVMNVFLDNAIEAASEAATKKISMFFLTNRGSTNIVIENTFKEKHNILPSEPGFYNKGENNNQELGSASSILCKYPNILNNIFVQHQIFVQELQIIK